MRSSATAAARARPRSAPALMPRPLPPIDRRGAIRIQIVQFGLTGSVTFLARLRSDQASSPQTDEIFSAVTKKPDLAVGLFHSSLCARADFRVQRSTQRERFLPNSPFSTFELSANRLSRHILTRQRFKLADILCGPTTTNPPFSLCHFKISCTCSMNKTPIIK